jgi:hypothetical protein
LRYDITARKAEAGGFFAEAGSNPAGVARKGDFMFTENSLFSTFQKVNSRDAANRFVVKTLHGDEVVFDRTTALMWQQSSSSQQMIYSLALEWINSLNKRSFAGFNDWRLPTLEEAMTLMKQSPTSAGLYIDPVFNFKQRSWIWTSDRGEADSAWYVNFNYGYSKLNRIKSGNNHVRAVRRYL